MTIGVILPHLQQFGGVRRFLEVGNIFIDRGIDYTVFARKGQSCDWFDFKGPIRDWSNISADRMLIGDGPNLRILPRVRSRIYVFVIAGGRFIPMYQSVYGKYSFILNNRVFQRYFPKAYLVEGGVNIHRFKPNKPRVPSNKVRVLFYGVLREGKDTKYIRHSLQGIPGVEPISLQGLSDENLVKAYHNGDFLVTWETRPGWSNMAAEALACGLTVVTNGINCEPFANRVIKTNDLRKFFSNPHNRMIRKQHSMDDFSWEIVVDKLTHILSRPAQKKHHKHHHAR